MSDWYFWNPETDELTKAKYDILIDPKELWEPEHLAISKNREENSRVAGTTIRGFWISTVFLSLDHSWRSEVPICFETMIFDHTRGFGSSWGEIYSDRYESGRKARAGHERIAGISRRLLLKAPQISKKNYKDVLRQI